MYALAGIYLILIRLCFIAPSTLLSAIATSKHKLVQETTEIDTMHKQKKGDTEWYESDTSDTKLKAIVKNS